MVVDAYSTAVGVSGCWVTGHGEGDEWVVVDLLCWGVEERVTERWERKIEFKTE